MNCNEFIIYIKSQIKMLNLNNSDVETLNFYIRLVKEIEIINQELYGDIGPPYLRKFMLPEDYIKICRDLKNIRIAKFVKLMKEIKKYLKKLKLPDEEYTKTCREYEKKYARQLNLRIDYDRYNQLRFK